MASPPGTDHGPEQAATKRPGRLRRAAVVLVALAVVAVVLRTTLNRNETETKTSTEPFTTEFPVFGTFGRLKFWAPQAKAAGAAEAVTTELYTLNRAINIYDPQSELSRLNGVAADHPVACSDRLWKILVAARRAWRETDGAFDVSVGPLMDLWGFHRKRRTLPGEAELQAARLKVGLEKVRFDDHAHTVAFTIPGMFLDLGGIAKGYALDIAARIAAAKGIRCGLIDLGGNIWCFPEPPPGRNAYEIGVRDPFDGTRMLGTVAMRGQAIATSGNYEQFVVLDGKRITHIENPATGRPVEDVAAVSVLTRRGVDSDVFSTAIFVAGDKLAEHFVVSRPGSAVMCVRIRAEDRPELAQWGWQWHSKLPPLEQIEAGKRPEKSGP